MIKPFSIYEKATGKIISCKICDPEDIRLKEGQGMVDGIFNDIEYVVTAAGEGQPTATRKPQPEIDAYHAEQKAHLEKAEALNVDPASIMIQALAKKGIVLTDADLASAKADLQDVALSELEQQPNP